MSTYTETLAELVALQGQLDQQLAQATERVAAERRRSEQEIEHHTEEHETVLARLEATLARARAEGVTVGAAVREPVQVGADPLDQAGQLVARLERALEQVLHTRKALVAEEAALSEEEKRRAAADRQRREREGLRRDEVWERARQGSNGLLAGLAVFAAAGLVAGIVGAAATLAIPALAALFAFALAAALDTTLPALAVKRATGVVPDLPSAPPRESRLGDGGYAGVAMALSGVCGLIAALATGSDGFAPLAAAILTLVGIAVTVCIWVALPRTR